MSGEGGGRRRRRAKVEGETVVSGRRKDSRTGVGERGGGVRPREVGAWGWEDRRIRRSRCGCVGRKRFRNH